MVNGVIIKSLSGFYYVKTECGVLTCKGAGKIKYSGLTPLVGDYVTVNENNIIISILKRKNSFIRPAVANIDMLVFVATNTKPVTDPFLIDRVSVIANHANCEFLLCINKCDLDDGEDIYNIYKGTDISTIKTSAQTGIGIETLKTYLSGKISAFTGNSGVGKSSLLNRLIPEACAETNSISEKLGRGKHTTRFVQLYSFDNNSFIADTPGYASFDIQMIDNIKKEELELLFPEFNKYIGMCRFPDCIHINEPNCSIKKAINDGNICQSRYDSYVKLCYYSQQKSVKKVSRICDSLK